MGGKKRKVKEARTSGWESKRNILSKFLLTINSGSFLSIAVPLCSIFPSPEPNPGLSHYQGSLNTGGSLPDLSNLHFPSPLSTPLDPEDNGGYPNLSGGSSTGNLPAAMMHLGISNSQGGWSHS